MEFAQNPGLAKFVVRSLAVDGEVVERSWEASSVAKKILQSACIRA